MTADSSPPLEDHQAGGVPPLGLPPERLLMGTDRVPFPVAEHENVGAGEFSAVGPAGKIREMSDPLLVDLGDNAVGSPEEPPAVVCAWETVDRSVALEDPVFGVFRFGKLYTDIACEDEESLRESGGDATEEGEPFMGDCLSVEIDSRCLPSECFLIGYTFKSYDECFYCATIPASEGVK